MNQTPRSAYDAVGGFTYFPRMLDKIRLHAKGELRPDFHGNLGIGADAKCADYLRVKYPELRERVLAGGTDEEILEWCYARGRRLNDTDLFVWNEFVRKIGWNDYASTRLEELKAESGLSDRSDIMTMAEYFEYDEGRKR